MPSEQRKKWYQYPLVWMLIGLPLSAVIGSMITIYFAVTTEDGLVADDYYQKGKEINLDLARDRAATAYQLKATITIDYASRQLTLQFDKGTLQLKPETLQLAFFHATRQGNDFELSLNTSLQGDYYALLPTLSQGKWHLQLSDANWRLKGYFIAPDTKNISLTALQ